MLPFRKHQRYLWMKKCLLIWYGICIEYSTRILIQYQVYNFIFLKEIFSLLSDQVFQLTDNK